MCSSRENLIRTNTNVICGRYVPKSANKAPDKLAPPLYVPSITRHLSDLFKSNQILSNAKEKMAKGTSAPSLDDGA